jgi:hypothetical protein
MILLNMYFRNILISFVKIVILYNNSIIYLGHSNSFYEHSMLKKLQEHTNILQRNIISYNKKTVKQ